MTNSATVNKNQRQNNHLKKNRNNAATELDIIPMQEETPAQSFQNFFGKRITSHINSTKELGKACVITNQIRDFFYQEEDKSVQSAQKTELNLQDDDDSDDEYAYMPSLFHQHLMIIVIWNQNLQHLILKTRVKKTTISRSN